MLNLGWKQRAFIKKVNSRCFCWFPAAILVHQNGTPIWRLHTKLYKGAWNVSANYSETVRQKDLRLGQIVFILVFYNISFSWSSSTGRFPIYFLPRDSENDLQRYIAKYVYKSMNYLTCGISSSFCLKSGFLSDFEGVWVRRLPFLIIEGQLVLLLLEQ